MDGDEVGKHTGCTAHSFFPSVSSMSVGRLILCGVLACQIPATIVRRLIHTELHIQLVFAELCDGAQGGGSARVALFGCFAARWAVRLVFGRFIAAWHSSSIRGFAMRRQLSYMYPLKEGLSSVQDVKKGASIPREASTLSFIPNCCFPLYVCGASWYNKAI